MTFAANSIVATYRLAGEYRGFIRSQRLAVRPPVHAALLEREVRQREAVPVARRRRTFNFDEVGLRLGSQAVEAMQLREVAREMREKEQVRPAIVVGRHELNSYRTIRCSFRARHGSSFLRMALSIIYL